MGLGNGRFNISVQESTSALVPLDCVRVNDSAPCPDAGERPGRLAEIRIPGPVSRKRPVKRTDVKAAARHQGSAKVLSHESGAPCAPDSKSENRSGHATRIHGLRNLCPRAITCS